MFAFEGMALCRRIFIFVVEVSTFRPNCKVSMNAVIEVGDQKTCRSYATIPV